MKPLLPFLLFALLTYQVGACTFSPVSFCQGQLIDDVDLLISGKITATDNNGIDLEILTLFRGTEDRTLIRIWSGTDIDCNGLFSMAATDLGEVGDTLILSLPRIAAIENEWDVIGDYRRPEYFSSISELRVTNGTVRGFIAGVPGAPPGINITSFNYEAFVAAWIDQGDCTTIVNTDSPVEQVTEIKYHNPVKNELQLLFTDWPQVATVALYAPQNGQLLFREERPNNTVIDLSAYPSGIYILRIQFRNGQQQIAKVLKM